MIGENLFNGFIDAFLYFIRWADATIIIDLPSQNLHLSLLDLSIGSFVSGLVLDVVANFASVRADAKSGTKWHE